MKRSWNFSAGPAMLPLPVLEQAAAEMVDWQGSGMSVMEMSHRSPEFMSIRARAEADLRELLRIPSGYAVLFLQGGGMGASAIVPMNLIGRSGRADYVVTGHWSASAASEAGKYGSVNIAASAAEDGFRSIPAQAHWRLDARAAYVHLCSNETIGGVQFPAFPDLQGVPLVADMSSDFLSRRIDVERFGLIYAGAQKNVGPAGLTIVIVRQDLLGHALPLTPSVFDCQAQARADSMLNTPPTYAIYIAGLVFRHLLEHGGIDAVERRNREKARLLYDCLDASRLFHNWINPACRSLVNVPFKLRDEDLQERFLEGAGARGLLALRGHRSVGGLRASLYNAMPLAGVQALVEHLREFEAAAGC